MNEDISKTHVKFTKDTLTKEDQKLPKLQKLFLAKRIFQG